MPSSAIAAIFEAGGPSEWTASDSENGLQPVPWLPGGPVVEGLEAAITLRAARLHASTAMVSSLSVRMCRHLGLDEAQQRLVDLCARVRDVGMIGLPDTVVLSSDRLSPEQWQAMNNHPAMGAELLDRLSETRAAAEIVRAHHERWDGGGYPDGLRGEAIPLLSRVIAAADAFVAIASDRPHRRGAGVDIALEHIATERGSQFDPLVVDALFAVVQGTAAMPAEAQREEASIERADGAEARAPGSRPASPLSRALEALDDLPAFGPACDRAKDAAADGPERGGELVTAIEGDLGLTVAVLRQAQRLPDRRPINNVPDAVAALGSLRVQSVIATRRCIAFPWRTPQQGLIYELRVHGQMVARAVDRIAQELSLRDRDDLIAAALLHDIGKLVIALTRPDDRGRAADPVIHTPEQRVREELRELNMDHASLGAVLIDRWGLPDQLSRAVGAHHSADSTTQPATLLRLADLVARHAHGDMVDRRVMLRLASACGLPLASLRDVLFDLPQSGSQRRRAQPSPLSKRETDALRLLAGGKVYKEMAAELGISASTIRTHLHSVYSKLKVDDRAQAVLRATEMGWI